MIPQALGHLSLGEAEGSCHRRQVLPGLVALGSCSHQGLTLQHRALFWSRTGPVASAITLPGPRELPLLAPAASGPSPTSSRS